MERKTKRQSEKSLFMRQYTNLLHLLCEELLYFTFTNNFFNKAKAVLLSANHSVLAFILMFMLLFPLTVFVSCQPLWESWWSKIKGIQFLRSTGIQELPGLNRCCSRNALKGRRQQQKGTEKEEKKTKIQREKQNYCVGYSVKYSSNFQMLMSNDKCWISIFHPQELAWLYKFLYNTVGKKFIVA